MINENEEVPSLLVGVDLQSESHITSEEQKSENDEEKLKEREEEINHEISELDEATRKRIRNLEFAAHRYLWYPDMNSTDKVRVSSGL